MAVARASGFIGRSTERSALDGLLATARDGQSGVLVVRGEAGIGKTALLRYAARQAGGFRVAQVVGVQAEMELPFAGIHQLCAPMLPRVDALPAPQRDALNVALGVASGAVPDHFLVGLAVLGLLSAAAEERPLLCLVEDAQWLDAASSHILGFVGRRMLAESVAIVIAVREPAAGADFDRLPELWLEGLDDHAARALLAGTVAGRLDEHVRDRIIAETRANPLALLELPGRMSAAELAGGFELPAAAADLPAHIEDHYARRVDELPEATRRLLLLAAADPLGDATLVWRAGRQLGLDTAALTPAEEAELLEIGSPVRFRHPLVRSAVYRAASADSRQRVHEALAEVTDPEDDADRRAWHRALAARAPDEDVAAELERSAGRAQARGGVAATAAFLQRAVALTPDPARRATRALAAAQASVQSAAFDTAFALLAVADARRRPRGGARPCRPAPGPAGVHLPARYGGDDAAARRRAPARAPGRAGSHARRTSTRSPRRCSGRGSTARSGCRRWPTSPVTRHARRTRSPGPRTCCSTRSSPSQTTTRRPYRPAGRPSGGSPAIRRSAQERLRWLWQGCVIALEMWDDERAYELSGRSVDIARETGTLSELALALSARTPVLVFCGELSAAASTVAETESVQEATGIGAAPYGALILDAWRGRTEETRDLIETTTREAGARGEGIGLAICEYARAVLCNGAGRYEEALAAALSASEHREVVVENWGLGELAEAATRCGRRDLAAAGVGPPGRQGPGGTDRLGARARGAHAGAAERGR